VPAISRKIAEWSKRRSTSFTGGRTAWYSVEAVYRITSIAPKMLKLAIRHGSP